MERRKKNVDEYDEIYHDDSSDSNYEDDKYYNSIPDYLGYLPDCPNCGRQLKYNYIESKYKCFSCGKEYDEYDILIDEYPTEKPFCCKNCGGPWPDCKTSCKIFDD